jgi:hypothetical protein
MDIQELQKTHAEHAKRVADWRKWRAAYDGTDAIIAGNYFTRHERESDDNSQLPPELLRKGRMDEIFFVDLPDDAERDAIWRIHIGRRGRDADTFDIHAFVQLSEGFTGRTLVQIPMGK